MEHIQLPPSTMLNSVRIDRYARIIRSAFKDRRKVLKAWNQLPPLIYESNIQRLIDAQYLCAIKEVNILQPEDLKLSLIELYYTWVLFHCRYKPVPSALLSLANFSQFKRSWVSVNKQFRFIVDPNQQFEDYSEELIQVQDPYQMQINFYGSFSHCK